MKVNRERLIQALETVKPGLARRAFIEQTSDFVFTDGYILTYNDDVAVSCPFDLGGIEGSVPSDEFLAFLRKLESEEVRVKTKENEIILSAKRNRAGFALTKEIMIPIMNRVEKWSKVPRELLESMKFVVDVCSKDLAYPILGCVYVDTKGRVVACDNYRLAIVDLREKLGISSFLIPAKAVRSLPDEGLESMALEKGWVRFLFGERAIYSCRMYDENYPSFDHLLDVEGEIIEFPEELDAILERAGIFLKHNDETDKEIKVILDSGKIKIRSTGNRAWFEGELGIDWDRKKLIFEISVEAFRWILKRVRRAIVGNSKIRFDGENFVYLSTLRSGE